MTETPLSWAVIAGPLFSETGVHPTELADLLLSLLSLLEKQLSDGSLLEMVAEPGLRPQLHCILKADTWWTSGVLAIETISTYGGSFGFTISPLEAGKPLTGERLEVARRLKGKLLGHFGALCADPPEWLVGLAQV